MPPIVFVASSTAQGAGTVAAAGKPAGVQESDVLLAGIVFSGGTPPMAPAGWTSVLDNTTLNGKLRQVVFLRVVSASGEPDSYSFTFTPKRSFAVVISAYRGAAGAATAAVGQANGSSTSITAPSAQAPSEAMAVAFFGNRVIATITPPAGMDERAEISKVAGSPKLTIACADDLVAAGATGPRVAIASAASVNIGQMVLLIPSA